MNGSWESVKASFRRRFFVALELILAIVIDSLLFVCWLLVDHWVSLFVEWLHTEKNLHEYLAVAFRVIASGTVLVLAASQALSDIIEVLKTLYDQLRRDFSAKGAQQDGLEGTADEPA